MDFGRQSYSLSPTEVLFILKLISFLLFSSFTGVVLLIITLSVMIAFWSRQVCCHWSVVYSFLLERWRKDEVITASEIKDRLTLTLLLFVSSGCNEGVSDYRSITLSFLTARWLGQEIDRNNLVSLGNYVLFFGKKNYMTRREFVSNQIGWEWRWEQRWKYVEKERFVHPSIEGTSGKASASCAFLQTKKQLWVTSWNFRMIHTKIGKKENQTSVWHKVTF